jgi:hypothetical protein
MIAGVDPFRPGACGWVAAAGGEAAQQQGRTAASVSNPACAAQRDTHVFAMQRWMRAIP